MVSVDEWREGLGFRVGGWRGNFVDGMGWVVVLLVFPITITEPQVVWVRVRPRPSSGLCMCFFASGLHGMNVLNRVRRGESELSLC